MKPIFKEEREFLETKLGIDLPDGCWRSTTKIYLNHFDENPFLTFEVGYTSLIAHGARDS